MDAYLREDAAHEVRPPESLPERPGQGELCRISELGGDGRPFGRRLRASWTRVGEAPGYPSHVRLTATLTATRLDICAQPWTFTESRSGVSTCSADTYGHPRTWVEGSWKCLLIRMSHVRVVPGAPGICFGSSNFQPSRAKL